MRVRPSSRPALPVPVPAPGYPLGAALVLGLASGCGPADDTGPEGGAPCAAEARIMEHNPFGVLVTATCSRETALEVRYAGEGESDRVLPPRAAEAGTHEFEVLGIPAGTPVLVQVDAVEDDRRVAVARLEVATPPLPAAWAGCTATSSDGGPPGNPDEAVCIPAGVPEDRAILCLDRAGRPIWAFSLPDIERPLFLRPLPDGSFVVGGANLDELVVLDAASRVTSVVRISDLTGTRFRHEFIDGHDVIPITQGPWAGAIAFLTVSFEAITGVGKQAGAGIVVYDPAIREVLWDWHSFGQSGDGLAIDPALDCPGIPACFTANAIVHGVDGDGTQFFWLERNIVDGIARVDVASDRVDWSFGQGRDFRLVDDLDASEPQDLPTGGWPVNPHAPEILDRSGSRTRFLLFDNGSHQSVDPKGEVSRVVEYEIDESSRLATIRFTYGGRDAQPSARWLTKSGGNAVLLPHGDSFAFVSGTGGIFVSEVSYPGGEERWRLSCARWTGAYRLAWFPSMYDTTWMYEEESLTGGGDLTE